MRHFLYLIILILTFSKCKSPTKEPRQENRAKQNVAVLSEASLIEHVRKAIPAPFTDWVVFSNGTYLVITADSATNNLKLKAIEILKEQGPVYSGSPSGDFRTIKLKNDEGWIVGYDFEGLYTYVHPNELEIEKPSDVEVGILGRRKREKDSEELRIIYTSY